MYVLYVLKSVVNCCAGESYIANVIKGWFVPKIIVNLAENVQRVTYRFGVILLKLQSAITYALFRTLVLEKSNREECSFV